mmetsp:Transcript_8676/g.24946  ORF Transcript_8676/g.24946 Transcript_8676/m.24946 type:complete len:242 (+) Transcript_8676:1998-2723(+)
MQEVVNLSVVKNTCTEQTKNAFEVFSTPTRQSGLAWTCQSFNMVDGGGALLPPSLPLTVATTIICCCCHHCHTGGVGAPLSQSKGSARYSGRTYMSLVFFNPSTFSSKPPMSGHDCMGIFALLMLGIVFQSSFGMGFDPPLQLLLVDVHLSLQGPKSCLVLAHDVPYVLNPVDQTHIPQFLHVVWHVHQCDPVVTPPCGEGSGIVEAKYLNVLSGGEVVRQDGCLASLMVRAHNADVWGVH